MLGLEPVGCGGGEDLHLLAHPVAASALLEVGGELDIDVAQVGDVGGRIGQLRLAQRPARPIGEAVRLVEAVAGDSLHELVVGDGIAVAQHHGRNLRVDDGGRDNAGFVPADFDILTGGVEDLGDVLVGHQGKKGSEIDTVGERVDDDRLLGARHLRHAEPGVVGAFAQEFGVDRYERMPGHARASIRESHGRRNRLHER